jgi:dienelactone hydrolase
MIFIRRSVMRTEVDEAGIVGRFYARAGARRRPAILMLNGSDGGFPAEASARDLAQAGWPTLALAYFQDYAGQPASVPKALVEIPLEYFDRALAWMRRRPEIQGRAIVIMGQSRGGELSLLLGSLRPEVAGVIAYSPSDSLWQGIPPYGSEPAPTKAAWTLDGRPLPFRTSAWDPDKSIKAWFEEALPNEEAQIRVETIAGPILLISSTADTLWPSAASADAIEARRKARCRAPNVTNLKFDDASHLLMGFGPGITQMQIPGTDYTFDFGGSPSGTEHARNAGWRAVKAFMSRLG